MSGDDDVSSLNRILACERKAAECLDRVLPTESSHDPDFWSFSNIRDEHRHAAGKLELVIKDLGDEVRLNSGIAWPDVEPSSNSIKLRDDHEAIRNLLMGERKAIEECEKALRKDLSPIAKTVINMQILPVLRNHVETFRQYL